MLHPRRACQMAVVERNGFERAVEPTLTAHVIGSKPLIAIADVLRRGAEQVHVGGLVEGESRPRSGAKVAIAFVLGGISCCRCASKAEIDRPEGGWRRGGRRVTGRWARVAHPFGGRRQ